jgi:hypothetical protein
MSSLPRAISVLGIAPFEERVDEGECYGLRVFEIVRARSRKQARARAIAHKESEGDLAHPSKVGGWVLSVRCATCGACSPSMNGTGANSGAAASAGSASVAPPALLCGLVAIDASRSGRRFDGCSIERKRESVRLRCRAGLSGSSGADVFGHEAAMRTTAEFLQIAMTPSLGGLDIRLPTATRRLGGAINTDTTGWRQTASARGKRTPRCPIRIAIPTTCSVHPSIRRCR